ncbi:MAG: EAL domain-containing protein [Actinomycetota bacterium]|nr:EAL domain-containing protein [Actinomycetota bacterium]
MRSFSLTKALPLGPLLLGLGLTAFVVSNLNASLARDQQRANQQSARLLRSIAADAESNLLDQAKRIDVVAQAVVLGGEQGSIERHLDAVDAFDPTTGVRAVFSSRDGNVETFTRDGLILSRSMPDVSPGLGPVGDQFWGDGLAYGVDLPGTGAADAKVVVIVDRERLSVDSVATPEPGVTVRVAGLPDDAVPALRSNELDDVGEMLLDPETGGAAVLRPSTILGTAVTVEVVADSSVLWQAQSSLAPVVGVGGLVLSLLMAGLTHHVIRKIARAIAERDQAIAGRHAATARFRASFSHAPIGVVEVDTNGLILAANPRFASQLGYVAEELEALDILDLLDGEDRAEARDQLDGILRGAKDSSQGERRYRTRNGGAVWVRESLSMLATEDGVRHVLLQAEDISEERRSRAEHHRKALFDSLTGLPNRANLIARLNRAVEGERGPGEYVAVLFVDLDKFKEVNDTLGHAAGDLLLIEGAERLRRACRSSDTVARLGGDEFVVVCEGLPDEQVAEETARRFAEVLRDPMFFRDQKVPVSASIGLVVNSEPMPPDEILRQADSAMYRAKTSGRDRLVRFDVATPVQGRRSDGPLITESELRAAIDGDQLRLFYQPIVRSDDGSVCGLEALVRWEHPDHGLLIPSQFLGLAEEYSLLGRVDAWALEEGMAALARWAELEPASMGWYLIFNVGPANFNNRTFGKQVKGYLEQHGIDANRLVLERNETWFMTQTATAVLVTRELRALGVKISLDHFGTASASLNEMNSLEFDFLKIDRSFVRDAHDQTNYVLEAMKNMAKVLGLRAIVEGVETEAELRVVRKPGIDFVQGYFVGRPMPEADIIPSRATAEI